MKCYRSVDTWATFSVYRRSQDVNKLSGLAKKVRDQQTTPECLEKASCLPTIKKKESKQIT